MLHWLHKAIVKPLARPPTHLKGKVESYEFKYLNYFLIYAFPLAIIPLFLVRLYAGKVKAGEMIATTNF